MIRDAIVDEVRATRDELAKECDYDVHELFKVLRRLEAGSATDHVSFVSRTGAPEGAQRSNAADEPRTTPEARR